MQFNFPHTIAGSGEKMTALRTFVENGVEVLECDMEVKPKAGPPMHTHHRQAEIVTIVSGTMAYQIFDENPKYAYPGDSITIKAGIPHKFWNAGDDLLKCKLYITPPDNYLYFLTELYKSINVNNGRPGLYDGAFLLNRYKAEFAMLEIPVFVQKFIFPIVLLFGKMAGKGKKFKNAPVPVAV